VASLDARALLEDAGIPTVPAQLVKSAEEAVAAAEHFGYPVALKIESPDILHKTEAQGVRLGLRDADAVRWAYQAVIDSARRYRRDARIEGALVQPMAQGDAELVIGLKHDANFGVVVMVGLGGIHIEVLKDVVFRKAPVTDREADRMLQELKSRAVLEGVRGKGPVDRRALTRMISAVSRFGAAAGERLVELDLNPILCAPQGVAAVDWLMVLAEPHPNAAEPRQ
jgi:acetyltransferase